MKAAFGLLAFLLLTGFSLHRSLQQNDAKSMIQVMYQMEREAKALRKLIMEKQIVPARVDSIMDMRYSTPTDPDEITEGFRIMAEENLKRRAMIFTAGNAKSVFNKYVKSCITCHQQHCPGPIRRISNLYIE
jgi:septation ring formation regulator EzrA